MTKNLIIKSALKATSVYVYIFFFVFVFFLMDN